MPIPKSTAKPAAKIALYKKLFAIATEVPYLDPVVSLDDYFIDNTDEDSIAPNCWGYGRPSLAAIYARLKTIAQRDDVQGMVVLLHNDWRNNYHEWNDDELLTQLEQNPEEIYWPAGESILFYSTADLDTVTQWMEGLEGEVYSDYRPYVDSDTEIISGEHKALLNDGSFHPHAIACPENYTSYCLYWD